ncbi:LysR family transcriptional regulator [Fusibacter paucivorans]|uniref:LysR family transcriptional regulator n=1 Tax=Fusibacter paucivorans TaxID=76009 RepID=A0ABS5PTY9_9FIRM|nr:selenium metabolism-associated LysR family transcriptional regulator [Fusibacter paucivorans]MBS7528635.1 LysR family transcriptional regulator [Fusibacter paucivorans]
MDFKQLEAFVNVAKYKNFSKAGKALYLSQPTISMHISNLEKELGVSLFDRTSKEVNLTPSGHEFMRYALDMINMKNHALHDMMRANDTIKGAIQISTSSTPNLIILPKAIHTFQSLHPDVCFFIEEKSTNLILEDVCALTADIGLVGMHVVSDRFATHALFDDDFVFVAADHMHVPPVIELSDLRQFKIIHRSAQSATRIELERNFVEQGLDISLLDTVVETDDLNLLMVLVEKGLGISYISKHIFEQYQKSLAISAFSIKGVRPQKHIELIVNKRRTLSPAAEDFSKLIIRLFQNHDDENCNSKSVYPPL